MFRYCGIYCLRLHQALNLTECQDNDHYGSVFVTRSMRLITVIEYTRAIISVENFEKR